MRTALARSFHAQTPRTCWGMGWEGTSACRRWNCATQRELKGKLNSQHYVRHRADRSCASRKPREPTTALHGENTAFRILRLDRLPFDPLTLNGQRTMMDNDGWTMMLTRQRRGNRFSIYCTQNCVVWGRLYRQFKNTTKSTRSIVRSLVRIENLSQLLLLGPRHKRHLLPLVIEQKRRGNTNIQALPKLLACAGHHNLEKDRHTNQANCFACTDVRQHLDKVCVWVLVPHAHQLGQHKLAWATPVFACTKCPSFPHMHTQTHLLDVNLTMTTVSPAVAISSSNCDALISCRSLLGVVISTSASAVHVLTIMGNVTGFIVAMYVV